MLLASSPPGFQLGKVARPFNLKAITVIMMAQTAVARLD